jgi:hypothetical protein
MEEALSHQHEKKHNVVVAGLLKFCLMISISVHHLFVLDIVSDCGRFSFFLSSFARHPSTFQ